MTHSSDANRRTISDHYRNLIVSGGLADGALLPPVVEIAQEYGVSKDVVTRAFRLLQAEGLIRVGRRGALVSSGEPAPDRSSWPEPGFRLLPAHDRVRVVEAGFAPAPEHIAALLQIDPWAAAIRRAVVHLHGDRLPVLYAVSWLHPKLMKSAPELGTTDSTASTDDILSAGLGSGITTDVDEVYARGATVDVARELALGEGAPLLVCCSRRVASTGNIVEVREIFIPADRRLFYGHTER